MRFDAVAFLEGLFQAKTFAPATFTNPSIQTSCDLPADWHFLWDERAAIMEYDGGMTREHAEAEALKEIIQGMKDNPGLFA